MENVKIPKVFSLSKICPMCGRRTYLRMTEEEKAQWHEYICYGGYIQDRFPNMDAQKREFIKSGYCPDCQKALFSTEHKVVLLSEFDLEDILYVDDEGNIKERQ